MEKALADPHRLKIAALADLHYGSQSRDPLTGLADLTAGADVLLLCGDLTDHGTPEEAQALVKELSNVRIPVLAVLGNHDVEAGREQEVQKVLTDFGVRVLDGEAVEVKGVGFAGAKGFCGGFGRGTLEPWGEKAIKAFVQEAVDESLKLESALARLRTHTLIALLHYSPIADTVEGEPPQIFPFLGSSRLEDPLNRYSVHACFHGHAHRGTASGKTRAGVTVYNVSLPLLRREFPEGPPIRMVEVDIEAGDEEASGI